MFIYSLNIDLTDEINDFVEGVQKVLAVSGINTTLADLRVVAENLVEEVVERAADAKEEQMKQQILQQALGDGS